MLKNLFIFLLLGGLIMAEGKAVAEETTVVVMQTSMGDIEITLYPEKAPITVENFKNYVKSGFYNGTIFHRVIDGFMIQGGGFTADMQQKKTNATIKNEANNGLKNTLGSIAMARTSDVDSATAQFFINTANNDFLNFKSPTPQGYGYCVFGQVTKGLDVVEKIQKVQTTMKASHRDVPVKPVTIESVSIKS